MTPLFSREDVAQWLLLEQLNLESKVLTIEENGSEDQ